MTHTCHARGCKAVVLPEMLMCRHHWLMVPQSSRNRVARCYMPGQCDGDPPPSKEWHQAAGAAIDFVAIKEEQAAR